MNNTPMSFEGLVAWQNARSLTQRIYALTRGGRLARDYGLSSQLQRAGVSTMSNVAEGYERHHVPEKLQFYNVAAGSSAEIRSLSYVVEDNYPEETESAKRLREEAKALSRIVSGLIRSTKARRTGTGILSLVHVLLPWLRF